MIKTIKKSLKKGGEVLIRFTDHASDRVAQRFDSNEELIASAASRAYRAITEIGGGSRRYNDDLTGATLVVERLGSNAIEIITCWHTGVIEEEE